VSALGKANFGREAEQLRAGTDYRSWQEPDLLTYFCNVCFWGAEMPPFYDRDGRILLKNSLAQEAMKY
jgi:hypothetical protein